MNPKHAVSHFWLFAATAVVAIAGCGLNSSTFVTDKNVTILPSTGEPSDSNSQLNFEVIDEVGARELVVEPKQVLLSGVPYKLILRGSTDQSISSTGPGALGTELFAWTLQSTPVNACELLPLETDLGEGRVLSCSQTATAEIRIYDRKAVLKGIIRRSFVSPDALLSASKNIYAEMCASCHQPLATSTKKGSSATLIMSGIMNIPEMDLPKLRLLTSAQIRALEIALKAPPAATPAPTPIPLTGEALYTANCFACHGSLASSNKRGKSADQILHAINTVASMRTPQLQSLTPEQINLIADALQLSVTPPSPTPTPDPTATPVPTPTPVPGYIPDSARGQNLYATRCMNCHSSLDNSTKKGRDANSIQLAIANVSQMNADAALRGLTANEIADIVAALGIAAPSTPPTLGHMILEQRFLLFRSPSGTGQDDNLVNNAIKNYINGQAEYIGGIYSFMDRVDNCNKNITCQEARLGGEMNAPASSIRRGYITRACEELLYREVPLVNILAKRSLTTASAFDQANITSMFNLFIPGRTPSAQVVGTLAAVGDAGKLSSGNSRDGWRFIVYSLCKSTAADLL